MDSKLIFIKAEYLIRKTDLERLPSGGWLYCGRSDDFREELVEQCINQHFEGDKIYFVTTRHNSRLELKSSLLSLIAATIDEENFTLWSEEFDKVMQFHNIGVFRFGGLCPITDS